MQSAFINYKVAIGSNRMINRRRMSNSDCEIIDAAFEIQEYDDPDGYVCLEEIPSSSNNEPQFKQAIIDKYAGPPLNIKDVRNMKDCEGRLVDLEELRVKVFARGIETDCRQEIWPYLLNVWDPHNTEREIEIITKVLVAKYKALMRKWQKIIRAHCPDFDFSISDNAIINKGRAIHTTEMIINSIHEAASDTADYSHENLEAKIWADRIVWSLNNFDETLHTISKDVLRTECTMKCKDNENRHKIGVRLRNGLLGFALLEPKIGYVQGMNDLLSRFYVAICGENNSDTLEALAFWCFHKYILYVHEDFLSDGMLRRITTLRRLLEVIDPQLSAYFRMKDVGELVFCHRWLLLAFQREFHIAEGLRLLEALMTHALELHSSIGCNARETMRKSLERHSKDRLSYDNPDLSFKFDLFVAVAILTLNRNRLLNDNDVSQLHMTIISLSRNIDPEETLRTAEQLFYKYCNIGIRDSFVII